MKHSVVLQYNRCLGCTTCIKSCPTEAIRVRNGKATILNDRCIDCGACIQACPHNAIRSLSDKLDQLSRFQYCVALPDPTLYGQFQNLDRIDRILNGLLTLGFHKVFEVARAGELLADYMRNCIHSTTAADRPQLSSACPAVLRLIRLRFPKLIPHVLPIIAPVELAAILARREAAAETGLSPEEIGVFSIVPCSSRVTAASAPDALAAPVIDGALAVRDIYFKLLTPMKELQTEDLLPLSHAGIMGVGWAYLGGMSAARLNDSYVAVDGIRNCIRMLEEIEDGRLPEVEFIELNACVRGCVGGCLNVANPFAAHMRIKKLMHDLPFARNRYDSKANGQDILFGRALQYIPAFVLDSDRGVALEKLTKIEELARTLPGLDCGSCGAPCCHALAEDVVLGRATLDDCIFKVRERMQQMQKRTGDCNADDYLPAPFRRRRRALVPPNSGKEEET